MDNKITILESRIAELESKLAGVEYASHKGVPSPSDKEYIELYLFFEELFKVFQVDYREFEVAGTVQDIPKLLELKKKYPGLLSHSMNKCSLNVGKLFYIVSGLLVGENMLFIINDETKHITRVNMFKGE